MNPTARANGIDESYQPRRLSMASPSETLTLSDP